MPKMNLDRVLQIAMGVLVILLIFAIYTPLHETLVQVGDSAPDFSIKTDDGRTLTRASFGGKVLPTGRGCLEIRQPALTQGSRIY